MNLRQIFSSFGRWALSFVEVLLVLWVAYSGWFAFACHREFDDGFSWGLLALLIYPFMGHPLGLFTAAIALITPVALVTRMRQPGGVAFVSVRMVLLAAGAFLLTYLVARVFDVSERCSFGF